MSETDADEFFDAEEDEIESIEQKMIYTFREKLPASMPSKANFSVWQFLKQCIGKELSKITMPIIFNEPISFLQRLSEYMEYSYLLKEAIEETNPIKRMEKVSGFAVSVVSSNWERVGKPFNPLLGETYELHTPNFKWISEQVSHHPPVSAFIAESPLFKFYGSIYPKLKFWGKSVEVTPKGNVTLELLPWKEVYTWQNVTCTVHNVIIGKIWIEHSGPMRIINHSNNLIADINFHSVGWFGKNIHRVDGDIYYTQQKSKEVERKLYGKWTEALFSIDPEQWRKETTRTASSNSANDTTSKSGNVDLTDEDDPLPQDDTPCDMKISNQKLIWKVNPKPFFNNAYYNFTSFTMGLNQINDFMKGVLCPTDSRFRSDMRYMEEGLIAEASDAKSYLEGKQRQKRCSPKKTNSKKRLNRVSSSNSSFCQENDNVIIEGPIWFSERMNINTVRIEWLYKGGYWDRDWSVCPEIF